ncbi:hypothetical protein C8R43DRAFT_519083 [Mycena crocata]|nr:hypothetical protein C8R43DRAFT_519083 [Mycena crocata]
MPFSHSPVPSDPAAAAHVRDLLRSNAHPPDNLPSTISAVSDQLARHGAAIEALQAQIRNLQSQVTALNAYRSDCRALQAPIRRLPVEILLKIFGFWPEWVGGGANNKFAEAPLLAPAHVCSWWRTLVFGAPLLWNTIVLHGQPRLHLLEWILKRSGGTFPLHVELSGSVHPSAIDLIASQSMRWIMLDIHNLSSESFSQLWSRTKGKLPNLSSLSIPGTSLSRKIEPLLPQLHTLDCPVVGPRNADIIVFLLSRLQGHCRLNIAANFTSSPSQYIPPTTSSIHTLSVEVDDGRIDEACVRHIFASLTFPRLRTLTYTSAGSPFCFPRWPHAEFLSLFTRSAFPAHLVSLEIGDAVITSDLEVLACLAALPALERLRISDHRCLRATVLLTDTLFDALTRTPDSPCLVARLRVLSFRSALSSHIPRFPAFAIGQFDASL